MANPNPQKDKPNQDLPEKDRPDRPGHDLPERPSRPDKPGDEAEPRKARASARKTDEEESAETEMQREQYLKEQTRSLLLDTPLQEGVAAALETLVAQFGEGSGVALRQRHAQNPVMWPDFSPAKTSEQTTNYHTAVHEAYAAHVPEKPEPAHAR